MTDYTLTNQELLDRYKLASDQLAAHLTRLSEQAHRLYKDPDQALANIDHGLEDDVSDTLMWLGFKPSQFGEYGTNDPQVLEDFKSAAERVSTSRKEQYAAHRDLKRREVSTSDKPKFRPHTKQRGCEPTR